MITRLGAVSNPGITDIPWWNKLQDLFLMASPSNYGTDVQAGAYEDIKYGTIPNVTSIVPNPGSPYSYDEMMGAWDPTQAASRGLQVAQAAQTKALKDAEGKTWFPEGNASIPDPSSLLPSIPWGTIAVVGAVILGAVVIVPMLGRK
jgi:hypothetical protein